jgi:hypothetical protein
LACRKPACRTFLKALIFTGLRQAFSVTCNTELHMRSFSSDPWDFSNHDENLSLNNKGKRIEYGDLKEVGMSAPLGGPGFLVDTTGRHQIHDWCGGPPIWEVEGDRIAIP